MVEPSPAAPRPRTDQRPHLVLYTALTLVLLSLLVIRLFRPLVLGEAIAVEPQRVAQVQQQVDPNTASWAELSRLPGVGESLAKRIVTHREEQRARRDGPIFRRPEDLTAVKGVGPKTLERITPGLRFPDGP